VRNFDRFRVDGTVPLASDLFVDASAPLPAGVSLDPVT
jgi:hypothetical protein